MKPSFAQLVLSPQDHTRSHQILSFPQFENFESPDAGRDERYRLMRAALLRYLVKESRVMAVFAHWEKLSGLGKLATGVAVTSDRLAHALGLLHRGPLSMHTISIDPRDRRIRTAYVAREHACAQFTKRIRSLPKTVLRDAVRVASGLKLPWPWVSLGLVHAFILQHSAVAIGMPFSLSLALPQPSITVNLSTPPRALRAQMLAARQRQRQRGRVPKKKAGAIDRYAYWYCRNRIGEVSVRQLAKEYHDTYHTSLSNDDCPNDRSLVTKGIKVVNNLLTLTQYKYQSK